MAEMSPKVVKNHGPKTQLLEIGIGMFCSMGRWLLHNPPFYNSLPLDCEMQDLLLCAHKKANF